MEEEIIKKLKDKLTGDKKHDVEIIKNSIDEYKNTHKEYDEETLNEFTNILATYIPNETVKKMQKLNESLKKEIIDGNKKAEDEITKGNYEEALKILNPIINDVYPYFVPQNSTKVRYVDFINPIEEILFAVYYDTKDKKIVNTPVPLTNLHFLISYTFSNLKDYKKMIKYASLGLKFNPVSVPLLSETIEYFKINKDFNRIKSLIPLVIRFSYTIETFLNTLTYFELIEIEENKASQAYYLCSLIQALTSDEKLLEFVDNEKDYIDNYYSNEINEENLTLLLIFEEFGIKDDFLNINLNAFKEILKLGKLKEEEKKILKNTIVEYETLINKINEYESMN